MVTCRVEDVNVDPHTENAPCPVSSANAPDATAENTESTRAKKKQPRQLPFPGMDFEFLYSDNGLTDMHLNIKFKKSLDRSDTVRMTMNGGQLEDGALNVASLEVGDEFIKDGIACEVSSIENGKAKCVRGAVRHESDGAAFELDTLEATHLVQECLQKQ